MCCDVLKIDTHGEGGDDVLFFHAVGDEGMVFVVENEIEREVLGYLGAQRGDARNNVVVGQAFHRPHQRRLPEGGVLYHQVVGNSVPHFEPQRETAHHLLQRGAVVAVVGVILHVGRTYGVVAAGVGVDAVFHSEQRT